MSIDLRMSKLDLLMIAAGDVLISDTISSIPSSDLKMELSKKHKRRMNRLFRTHCGCHHVPYPEADTKFTRLCDGFLKPFISIRDDIIRYSQKKRTRALRIELYRKMFDFLEDNQTAQPITKITVSTCSSVTARDTADTTAS